MTTHTAPATHTIVDTLNTCATPAQVNTYIATLDYDFTATINANKHNRHFTTFTLTDGRTFTRHPNGTWTPAGTTPPNPAQQLRNDQADARGYVNAATTNPTVGALWRAGAAIAALERTERAAAIPPWASTAAALRGELRTLTRS